MKHLYDTLRIQQENTEAGLDEEFENLAEDNEEGRKDLPPSNLIPGPHVSSEAEDLEEIGADGE